VSLLTTIVPSPVGVSCGHDYSDLHCRTAGKSDSIPTPEFAGRRAVQNSTGCFAPVRLGLLTHRAGFERVKCRILMSRLP
jgi:hypothetical protein